QRAPRRLLPTEAGDDLLQRARRVLADIEQMRETARQSRDPEAGTLRLGLFPTLGPYLLPHVVGPLRARFPRLELLLVEEKTEVLLARLRDGKVDAAVLALPVDTEALEHTPLFEEPFVLAVPADHALARRRGPLPLDALHDAHLLLLEEGHCLRAQALDVCHLAGATEKAGFRATSLETLRQMVAAGVGITLLPVLAVRPPVAPLATLKLLPFATPAPRRAIALFWRKSSARAPMLEALAGVLRDLPSALLQARP
ncbi:MAG: LysR substrate-binding domain-containing protein, partial [Lysobacteraceae bacterium]